MFIGIVKSPLGGDFITNQCTQHFEDNGIEVIPPYMIAGKEQVWENEKAKYTKRSNIPDVTKSWHKYMVKVNAKNLLNNEGIRHDVNVYFFQQVVQDFQQTIIQVADSPYDEETAQTMPQQAYEFPNGYHQVKILELKINLFVIEIF